MKAIVGIYRHDPRANKDQGQSRLASTIDMEVQVKELIRRKDWKGEVMRKVQEIVGDNVDVLAVSLVKDGADLNVTIAVTIDNKPPRFGERRKPVTRGGRSLGSGPVKTGKTMGGKRRNDGRSRPR